MKATWEGQGAERERERERERGKGNRWSLTGQGRRREVTLTAPCGTARRRTPNSKTNDDKVVSNTCCRPARSRRRHRHCPAHTHTHTHTHTHNSAQRRKTPQVSPNLEITVFFQEVPPPHFCMHSLCPHHSATDCSISPP